MCITLVIITSNTTIIYELFLHGRHKCIFLYLIFLTIKMLMLLLSSFMNEKIEAQRETWLGLPNNSVVGLDSNPHVRSKTTYDDIINFVR